MKVGAVVPALNEEGAIGSVVSGLLGKGADCVVVVDNGSTDLTAERARAAGAIVVGEPVRGYGKACLTGLRRLRRETVDIVLFADGDGADDLDAVDRLIDPIAADTADFVLGRRDGGGDSAVPMHAQAGNRLAVFFLWALFGAQYKDLGPFRAIRSRSLDVLGMADEAFGWTVEMQAKANLAKLRVLEVPVHYNTRTGRSKISGTVLGSLRAGHGILSTIFLIALKRGRLTREMALRRFRVEASGDGPHEALSVIVPVLNDAEFLPLALASATAADEVIVVDGGSADGSPAVAAEWGAKVVVARAGRGRQMNAGADEARGDVLLFLHADTVLPKGFRDDVFASLGAFEARWGRFDLRFDVGGPLLRLIAWLISNRSRITRGATGDQAIFVERDLFRQLGGYREPGLFEDVALCRALKAESTLALPAASVVTSSRRWRDNGVWKTTFLMWSLKFLYLLGVPAAKLETFYRDVR